MSTVKPENRPNPIQNRPSAAPQRPTAQGPASEKTGDRFTKSEDSDTDLRQRNDDRSLREMAMRQASRNDQDGDDVDDRIDQAVGNALVGQAVGDELNEALGDTLGGAVADGLSQAVGEAVVDAANATLGGGLPAPGAVPGQVLEGAAQGFANGATAGAAGLVGGLAGQAAGAVLGDEGGTVVGAAVGNAVNQSLGQSLFGAATNSASVTAVGALGNAGSALAGGALNGVGSVVGMQAGAQVVSALDGVVGQEAAGLAGSATSGFVGAGVGSLLGGGTVTGALTAAGPYGAAAALAPVVAMNTVSGVQALFSDDRDLTFTEQASLALPTFGLSFLANPIKNLFGGGKDRDQMKRDQIRGFLQDGGFLDQDYRVRLADGTGFDMGGETVRDAEGNALGRIYELPWDREITPRAVGLAQAIAASVVGEDEFFTGSFTMMLTNAALSNAGDDFGAARDNLRQMTADLGLTPESMVDRILTLRDQGAIDDQKAEVYLQGVRGLFVDEPERDAAPLSPEAFPEFARPTLRGYSLDQLFAVGWDEATLTVMYEEGRLELAA